MPAKGCRGADTRDAPGHQEAALATAACSWFPVLEELPCWGDEQSPRDLTPALLPSLTPPPRPPALGPGRGSSSARSRGASPPSPQGAEPPGAPLCRGGSPGRTEGTSCCSLSPPCPSPSQLGRGDTPVPCSP